MNLVATEEDFRSGWGVLADLVFTYRDALADAADFRFEYAAITWPHRASATFSAERAAGLTDYLYVSATRDREDEDWKVVHRLILAQP
ncbi:MAG: hypothetical protein ACXWVT_03255 [Burkholderiaceae bacterium]